MNILSKSAMDGSRFNDDLLLPPHFDYNDDDDVISDAAEASSASDVDSVGRIADLDVDPYAMKLYYSDTQRHSIVVVNISSRFEVIGEVINSDEVSGDDEYGCSGSQPRDVAVDAVNGCVCGLDVIL